MPRPAARPIALLVPFIAVAALGGGCWASHPQPRDESPAPGLPDSDLPLFAPASKGMVWTSRNYDMAGHGVGNELEELVDFDDGAVKTRRIKVTEDVEDGPSQFSTVIETIFPDRIEAVNEETGRLKVLLRTPLRPGTTWTYPRGNGAGEERRTITGIEDVCTRWGFFPGALKVEGMTLGPRPGGGEPLRTHTEEWFYKGVGRVQVVAHVDSKPELDLRSVLDGVMDPEADSPFKPSPCPGSSD